MATAAQNVPFGQILVKYWWRHLIMLALLSLFIWAGFWQLGRLEQRRALNVQITAGLNRTPIALTGQPVDPATLHYQRVTVTGVYENDQTMILKTQTYEGRAGIDLIVPLRIEGSDQLVLINRGWLPFDQFEPSNREKYAVEGPVTIEGVAYRSQAPPHRFAPSDPDPQPGQWVDSWFRIDIPKIQQQFETPLLPIYVQALPDPSPSDEPPLREPATDLGPGSHLSYAIQWFAFAIILTVTYAGFTWQEIKNRL